MPEFMPTVQAEPTRAVEILAQQAPESTYGRPRDSNTMPRLGDIINAEEKHYREKVTFFMNFFPILPVKYIEDVIRKCR